MEHIDSIPVDSDAESFVPSNFENNFETPKPYIEMMNNLTRRADNLTIKGTLKILILIKIFKFNFTDIQFFLKETQDDLDAELVKSFLLNNFKNHDYKNNIITENMIVTKPEDLNIDATVIDINCLKKYCDEDAYA